jgi:sugar/nucleoside kinase (ribokinase family)
MCVDLIMDLGDVVPQFGQVEQWVDDYFMEMGGSACIFACQAAKLGLSTGIFGRVGPDPAGALMLKRLNDSGVDTRLVIEEPVLKTGLGVSLCKLDGDRSILTYGGSLNAVYPADITTTSCAVAATCTIAATTSRPTCCRISRASWGAPARWG